MADEGEKKADHGWAAVLGVLLCAGLGLLGWQVSHGIVTLRSLERSVSVKGLSEREVEADLAIWPVSFNETADQLVPLYEAIAAKNGVVVDYLKRHGFSEAEISVGPPAVTDRLAQNWGDGGQRPRYSGGSTVTVYAPKVAAVRAAMTGLVELGRAGIALAGQEYGSRPEFLFTKLNQLKPSMVEEATRNAREVAQKFASDSGSTLGRIRTASQGIFSIEDRDSSTPHIKRVRVVSTVEYYLTD